MPRRLPTRHQDWRPVASAVLAMIAVGALAMAATHDPLEVVDRAGRARVSLDSVATGAFSALAVFGVVVLVLFVWSLVTGRQPGKLPIRKPWWQQVLSMLFLLALLLLLGQASRAGRERETEREEANTERAEATDPSPVAPSEDRGDDRWAALLGAAAAVIAIGAIAVAARHRGAGSAAPPADAEPDDLAMDTVATVLDEATDDLLAEPDPRRAIVAAFSRMESGLARCGLPRSRSETAVEYVGRVLSSLPDPHGALHPAIARLTELYLPARYSDHAMADGARIQAVAALRTIRAGLPATVPAPVPAPVPA